MRSGDLRHRVMIQRKVSHLGQWGHVSSWTDIATVAAKVKATGGAERFDNKTSGVNGQTTYEITLRYRADLKSTDRVIHRGAVLDLVSVIDPDGRRRELVCQCVQHGAGEAAA